MKLSEIFAHLTSGELSQLGMGGAKGGAIVEKDYPKILSHVNLGLTDIFSRFTIKQGRLVLLPQPGKTTYSLTAAFAVNNRRSREEVRYILDTPEEPFVDDLTKVERVLTDAGHELALNVIGNPESVVTPSDTVLRLPKIMVLPGSMGVPDHLKTVELEIFYRATHPAIIKGIGPFDPARIEISLPRIYLQALLYFVAARAHAPVGMGQEFYSGNVYAQKYELECARLINANVQMDEQRENTRLERNGWV